MGEITGISWTDHTFNPWIGCTKVSPACDNCYAEALSQRYGWAEWGNHPRKRTSEATWRNPLAWDRKAAKDGVKRFVFCASLADVFDNQVDPQWRADLWALTRQTPNLIWLMLTKRPQNIARMLPDHSVPNVSLGCTIVTQAEAERDLPHLLLTPGGLHRFVSIEPMLGPIDLGAIKIGRSEPGRTPLHASGGGSRRLDWVIVGGESGEGARPVDPQWVRAVRDDCEAAGVAFHFKQWGGRTPKANGKELDGREWCERPAPERVAA